MVRTLLMFGALWTATNLFANEPKPLDDVTLLKEAVYQERVLSNFHVAVKLYSELLKREKLPASLRDKARLGLAVCHMRNKDIDLAVKAFAKVFEESPTVAEAFLAESKLFGDSSYVKDYLKRREKMKTVSPLAKRLSSIVIKNVAFDDVKVSDAFKKIRKLSKTHDPSGKGINFNVILNVVPPHQGPGAIDDDDAEFDLGGDDPDEKKEEKEPEPTTETEKPEPTISLDFDDIPVGQLVRYICEQTGLHYSLEKNVVCIHPRHVTPGLIELRFFPIDPDLIRAFGETPEDAPPEVDFKRMFQELGVLFPYAPDGSGSSMSYDRGTNQLVVRNTPENLELMEQILKRLNITIPQLVLTENLVEVDVKESVLARVKPGKLSRFIMDLPDTRRKLLISRTQLIQSGQEGFIHTQGDIDWNGKNGYERSTLSFTPQVAADNLSISLSMSWEATIWNSKGDYLKDVSSEDDDSVVAMSNWQSAFRNEMTIWDQESICLRIAAAKPHIKRGALFLILKATLVDPAGEPIRDPAVPLSNYLGARIMDTGE